MRAALDKDGLINVIQVRHRQLERYLFYFVKNEDGVFVAGDRTKFGRQEMLQPGFVDEWSLRDVLAYITRCEKRFISGYQACLRGETPPLEASTAELEPLDLEISSELRGQRLEETLSEFQRSFQDILSTVSSISEEELFTPGYYAWTGQETLTDFITACTYDRYEWAKGLIRRWRQAHPGEYLNKEVILERIQTERRRLEKTLDGLTENQKIERGVVGVWSVKDILAHLSDWERRFMGWYEAGLQGDVPETPAPGLTWGDLDILNQQIYKLHRDRDLAAVAAEFDRSYQQVLEMIMEMPEEDIFEAGRFEWLGEGNLVGYILANTANHYRWAKTQIQKWMKNQTKST